jgi:hypothetical protein
MPYKDKDKRYAAIRKSVAKKPELYKALGLNNKRKAHCRGYMIKRRYGITIEDYNVMLINQQGGCAICQKPSGFTKSGRCSLHVDHNHQTNKVRGLLCARCNCLVGYLDKSNSFELVNSVRSYLENNS